MRAEAEVRTLLRERHILPNPRRGQNFLIADQVYGSILHTADLTSDDTVLEIGAGLGTLTAQLQPLVHKVVAVEVDGHLAALLRQRFLDHSNVAIEEVDILSVSVAELGLSSPYKVVANIPYHITSAIFKKFLTQDIQPTTMTFLVQQEVGERITAAPGAMSLLSLSVQLYATPCVVMRVPKTSFLPPPKVDSVLLQVAGIHSFPFADVPEKFFWRVARMGFAARRKQLKNNLTAGFHLEPSMVKAIIVKAGLQLAARPQDLTLDDWHAIAWLLFGIVQ